MQGAGRCIADFIPSSCGGPPVLPAVTAAVPVADDHLGATLAFGLPLVEGAREEAVLLWQVADVLP